MTPPPGAAAAPVPAVETPPAPPRKAGSRARGGRRERPPSLPGAPDPAPSKARVPGEYVVRLPVDGSRVEVAAPATPEGVLVLRAADRKAHVVQVGSGERQRLPAGGALRIPALPLGRGKHRLSVDGRATGTITVR